LISYRFRPSRLFISALFSSGGEESLHADAPRAILALAAYKGSEVSKRLTVTIGNTDKIDILPFEFSSREG
jgi:hypothetical protein